MTKRRAHDPDNKELDETWTTGEVIEGLRRLRFARPSDRHTITLDKGVRDFILSALHRRRA